MQDDAVTGVGGLGVAERRRAEDPPAGDLGRLLVGTTDKSERLHQPPCTSVDGHSWQQGCQCDPPRCDAVWCDQVGCFRYTTCYCRDTVEPGCSDPCKHGLAETYMRALRGDAEEMVKREQAEYGVSETYMRALQGLDDTLESPYELRMLPVDVLGGAAPVKEKRGGAWQAVVGWLASVRAYAPRGGGRV